MGASSHSFETLRQRRCTSLLDQRPDVARRSRHRRFRAAKSKTGRVSAARCNFIPELTDQAKKSA
jgi:hypothetical protein